MKAIFAAFILLPLSIFAQKSSLKSMLKFSDADSSRTHASVSGKAFELMSYASIDTFFTVEAMKLAKSIHGMEGYMDLSKSSTEALFTKLESSKSMEKYAGMTSQKQRFAIYVDEKDGVVNEVILAAIVNNEGLAASIYGNMDMRLLGELFKLVPYNQFKNMEQHKNDKK